MAISFNGKLLSFKLVVGVAAIAVVAVSLASCGDKATLPVSAGTGADPQLPNPNSSIIPTVSVAPAKGWIDVAGPAAAAGLKSVAFAEGLDHPRWLYVLPNGDVLVAETNAPPKPEDAKGIKGWFMKRAMSEAGAATPSANRIILLRDADGDGIAEIRSTFLQNMNSPFGMALVGDTLFVANTDAVVKYPYKTGETQIAETGAKVADLPAGPINHHWTKSLIASRDGKHLYVGVGSNSNVGENGIDKEDGRAAIWEIDPATGGHSVYATGLRNPVGLAWEPVTGNLWAVVNERDELGSDLVPDYLTSVKYGKFYGWPYSYFGKHVDTRVSPRRPDLVARASTPDYALGPHVAPLGLAFGRKGDLPARYTDGAFVAQHGSWNREPKSGYKIVFVPFAKGQPAGQAIDVLTGFLDEDGNARGRPVGVALDRRGALLVADDVGNRIWRVSSDAHYADASVKAPIRSDVVASEPKSVSSAKLAPAKKKVSR